jgi:tetratricopeptide (TPR) repeat protein
MKLFYWVPQLLVLAALIGCSHAPSKHKRPIGYSEEQLALVNRGALTIASQRLEQLVNQARSSEAATKFLSNDLFLKGNMSLLEGDYITANILFKHLQDLVPNDEFIQKKYAVSLIKSGEIEAASPVLESLYEKGKEEKVGLILAGVYTGLDKEERARQIYQQILKKNPGSEDACIFLGKSYALAKQNERAIKILNKCAAKEPKNGMFDYYIGKIHVDAGRLGLAEAAFKNAQERQPALGQATSALGIIYEESEQAEKAIAIYKKHLIKSPMDSKILVRLVQVLFTKERYTEVIPYAERLSDLEPEDLNLKVKLGVLYSDAQKYAEALSIFRELLEHAPGSDKILYYLGAIHQELEQFEKSIEYFNQIPVSSGLYTDSSVQMANMLSALAQMNDKFNSDFLSLVNRKIDEIKDLRVEFSVIKAGYFEAKGQFKEAMEAMMVVQDEKGFSTQHKYYLANLYEKEKKFEASTALIMGILEAEPKNAHAWNFLGYAMLVRGEELDRAFEYIQKAHSISPNDGYIRDSLGWYYYKKGDKKRALQELQFAYKKVPDDVEILRHLAEIHRELKNVREAKGFLESALKHARYPSDRQQILVSIEELEHDRMPAATGRNQKNID